MWFLKKQHFFNETVLKPPVNKFLLIDPIPPKKSLLISQPHPFQIQLEASCKYISIYLYTSLLSVLFCHKCPPPPSPLKFIMNTFSIDQYMLLLDINCPCFVLFVNHYAYALHLFLSFDCINKIDAIRELYRLK